MISLIPGAVTLNTLEDIYFNMTPTALTPEARPAVERAAQMIADAAAGDAPVYGVNTGFGKFASLKIE